MRYIGRAALWAFALGTLCGFAKPEIEPVKAELIAEHGSIQPGGKTRVGVSFELEDGWHIYAEDPGDAGLATQVAWGSSSHWVQFGPLQWPKPQEFIDPGDIRTRGYSGAVVLHSTLTRNVPMVLRRNIFPTDEPQLQVRAEVKWLACKEICIPGGAQLELTLPVSEGKPALSTHANFFDHAS